MWTECQRWLVKKKQSRHQLSAFCLGIVGVVSLSEVPLRKMKHCHVIAPAVLNVVPALASASMGGAPRKVLLYPAGVCLSIMSL